VLFLPQSRAVERFISSAVPDMPVCRSQVPLAVQSHWVTQLLSTAIRPYPAAQMAPRSAGGTPEEVAVPNRCV
jgi:hypothetical protein